MKKKASQRRTAPLRQPAIRSRATLKRTLTKRTASKPRARPTQASAEEELPAMPVSSPPRPESELDVVQLILRDHQPLKALLETMKNYGLELGERQEAFEQFAPLLFRHARPEEQVIYGYLKSRELLREDGLEGDVEHALADQLIAELRRTEDLELWSARLKVLADLVEHHLAEEERALLPHFKQHVELAQREQLGQRYTALRAAFEVSQEDEAPDEIDEDPVGARDAMFGPPELPQERAPEAASGLEVEEHADDVAGPGLH